MLATCPSEGNWSFTITSHDCCSPQGKRVPVDMHVKTQTYLCSLFASFSKGLRTSLDERCYQNCHNNELRYIYVFILDLRCSVLTPFKNCIWREMPSALFFCILVTSSRAVIPHGGLSTIMQMRFQIVDHPCQVLRLGAASPRANPRKNKKMKSP